MFDHNNINVALNKAVAQSSTYQNYLSASAAVNGNLNDFFHTDLESGKLHYLLALIFLGYILHHTDIFYIYSCSQVLGGRWTWERALQCQE